MAVYSLADAVNVTFSFALRGAGDTRFVSLLTFALAWPIMVVPTFVVVRTGASIYSAWVFATAYIVAMAVCFFLRFRTGKWKSMRVIEAAPEGISLRLKTQIAEARVVIRAVAERPMEFTFILSDRQVVDARVADGHQSVVIELPVLVAV